MELSESLCKKLKNIKILVMDVDGVLTDSRVFFDSTLGWKRFFSVRDGVGLHLLRDEGYKTAMITGSHSEDVRLRAKDLKIDYFYENRLDKKPAYNDLKEVSGFNDHEISYIGDDLPDLPILKKVGFSATIPSAVEEVLNGCDYITKREGGYGAVRELCQLILQYGCYNNQ